MIWGVTIRSEIVVLTPEVWFLYQSLVKLDRAPFASMVAAVEASTVLCCRKVHGGVIVAFATGPEFVHVVLGGSCRRSSCAGAAAVVVSSR